MKNLSAAPKNAFRCKGYHLYSYGVLISPSNNDKDYTVELNKNTHWFEVYDSERNYVAGLSMEGYQRFESFVRSYSGRKRTNIKATISYVLSIVCLIVATVQSIMKMPNAAYFMGLACFNMIVHLGDRMEDK